MQGSTQGQASVVVTARSSPLGSRMQLRAGEKCKFGVLLVLPHGNRVKNGQVSMVIITAGCAAHFRSGTGSVAVLQAKSAGVNYLPF